MSNKIEFTPWKVVTEDATRYDIHTGKKLELTNYWVRNSIDHSINLQRSDTFTSGVSSPETMARMISAIPEMLDMLNAIHNRKYDLESNEDCFQDMYLEIMNKIGVKVEKHF